MITKKRIIISSILCMVLLLSASMTTMGSSERDEDARGGINHVNIIVFDLEENDLLPDTLLKFFRVEPNGNEEFLGEHFTDENGTFSGRLENGTYLVEAHHRGHEPGHIMFDTHGMNQSLNFEIGLMPIHHPEPVMVKIIPLSVEGEIIHEAVASLINIETGDGFREHMENERCIELEVPEGEYVMEVFAEGYEGFDDIIELWDIPDFTITVELIPEEEENEEALVTIEFLLENSDELVHHGRVEMINTETGEVYWGEIVDGFTILVLPWGHYKLIAEIPDHKPVEDGYEIFECVDFFITIVFGHMEEEFGFIEGKIFDIESGKPLPETYIFIESQEYWMEDDVPCDDGEFYNNENCGKWFFFETWTGENGEFYFDEIPMGEYIIYIEHPGFHEIREEFKVFEEMLFLEFGLRPFEDVKPEEFILITGNVFDGFSGEGIPHALISFHPYQEEPHHPEYRPHILFEYYDGDSDGNPEIMLLKADFDGDGKVDLHYVYIDENSDGNPEWIKVEASWMFPGFHMELPGLMEYLELMGYGWDHYEDEEWEEWDEEEEWWDEDEDWEDEDEWEDEDRTRGGKECKGEHKEKEYKEEGKEHCPPDPECEFLKVKTDDTGFFEIKVPMGVYTVTVEAEGYHPFKEVYMIFPEMEDKEEYDNEEIPSMELIFELRPYGEDEEAMNIVMDENENYDKKDIIGTEKEEIGSLDMDSLVDRFLENDDYDVDIEPFKEVLSDAKDNTAGEKKNSSTNTEGAESTVSYTSGTTGSIINLGAALGILLILLALLLVLKKRNSNKKERNPQKDDKMEIPPRRPEYDFKPLAPSPKVRTVRVTRRRQLKR